MSQSYPWIKLDHVSYRHGEFRAKASMQARYAYHELITIAPMQTPSFSIPNDDAVIAGWLNISVKQWLKVRDLVLSQFTQGDDGRFYCNMLVEIYSETNNETNAPTQPKRQRSNSAERVARYRAKSKPSNADVTPPVTHDVTPSNANVTPKNVTCNANVTPVTVTSVTNGGIKGGDLDLDLNKDLDLDLDLNQELKTKTTREASVCDARFDEFWIQYPRKENKQGAIKAFKKLKPSEKLFEEILSALSKQKTWPAFQNGYAPHAATWLNAKRWEDQPPINQTTSKPVTGIFNGQESDLMRANRAAAAEAKKMLFGEEAA